jgi:cytochrome b subunit of formate dehydrogenase
MKKYSRGQKIAFFVLMGLLAILVFGGVVMLLWNNVLAAVVNVHAITFPQALGLLILSKILFGGFRGAYAGRRHYWKQRMTEKWNNMSPQEREKFKTEWQRRCGRWGYKGWDAETPETNSGEHSSSTM